MFIYEFFFINSVIIINPKFAASANSEIWNTINGHIDKLKQDIFKQAGISVELYKRSDIKLTRGKITLHNRRLEINNVLNAKKLILNNSNVIILYCVNCTYPKLYL